MIGPGPRNSLTDVVGILVGQAEDERARTGVTVILPEEGTLLAAVDVRGGAPATLNTEGLAPGGLVDRLHGLTLAGGSSFGLEAATGLMAWLAHKGRGFTGWGPVVPFVSGAILFDLVNGGDKGWGTEPPYRRLAFQAAEAAGHEVRLGNAGAGMGAQAGPLQGGLGTASVVDAVTGITIAALAAVNSVGSVVMPGEAAFYAWYLEQAGELGCQEPPRQGIGHAFETKRRIGMNTSLAVLATDAALDVAALRRLAIHAQDGFAIAIRPVHTLFDGDTVFAVSTGRQVPPRRDDLLVRLGSLAADVTARAVMRGVYAAEDQGGMPGYRTVHGRRPATSSAS